MRSDTPQRDPQETRRRTSEAAARLLAVRRIEVAEKNAWMLRSHLEA